MTQEQHEKAIKLTAAIKEMKQHLYSVRDTKDTNGNLQFVSYRKSEYLLDKYLPIQKEDFVNLYIAKVEKAIADAETEFNNL